MIGQDLKGRMAANAHAINFAWLLRLRWGAIAGQVALVLIVDRVIRIALPLAPICLLVAAELATNVAGALWARWDRRIDEWMLGLLMAADVGFLTGLLYLTGGSSNPFSFLYLVYIALAAVVLRPRWTWGLTLLAIGCGGVLFRGHSSHLMHGADMQLHLQGMWVAFGVAAVFIVYFVQRVTRALADRDAELAAVRDRTARHDKLASLAALAAGAAHELSTPLSTIAVVAKELERQLARREDDSAAAADARVIREQVERCREILAQMAADAGESTGEPLTLVTGGELIEAALASLPDRQRVQVVVEPRVATQALQVPARAVGRALRALLDNARQAAPPPAPILVQVAAEAHGIRITVTDRGEGMRSEVLARAGEPFFSTRAPGRGMGLGLFLTRSLLDSLGGQLDLVSTPQGGTSASISLPAAPLRRAAGLAAADAVEAG
jgi:two-component system, sensor histidine kinase RegB